MRKQLIATLVVTGVLLSGPLTSPGDATTPGRGPDQAAAAETPATGRVLTPRRFGARGDGTTNDTAALQRALDALRPGDTLVLPRGKVYRHSQVLVVRVAGVRISGPGTLLASRESRSALFVDADGVVLDRGLTLKMKSTTRRWDAFEQMKLRIGRHTGVVVRDVTIDGSAAAGLYVGTGAANFLLEDVTVLSTRADGIHITGAAHDGVVRRAVVRSSGDDGIAVVSYGNESAPVRRVRVESPQVLGTRWGRGLSVVGGEDVTYRDITVSGTNAAGVYIAQEGAPYFTYAPRRVRVEGGTVTGANTNPDIDHGAVLVYGGRAGSGPVDVGVAGLTIAKTRRTAPFQVAVIAGSGAVLSTLRFDRITVRGGSQPFWSNAPRGTSIRTGWVVSP